MQTLEPHCIEALQILAHEYLRQRKTDRAQILLELLASMEPVNSELRLALAYALLCNDSPVEALKTLAALQSSRHAVAHLLRGRALAQTGRPQDARTEFARYSMLHTLAATHGQTGRPSLLRKP